MLFLDVTCTVTESLKKNKDYGLFDVLDLDCMIVVTLFRKSRRIQINGIYEKRALDHDKIYRFIQAGFDDFLAEKTFSNYEYEGYYYHLTSPKQARPFFAFTLVVRDGSPFAPSDLKWLDVYERLNYHRALIENEALQQKNLRTSLFENVGFPILVLDRKFKILQQNLEAFKLFGKTEGQPLRLSGGDQDLTLQQMLCQTMDTKSQQLNADFVFGPSDDTRVLFVTSSPLFDSKDKIAGAVLTAIDRTERRLLQMENEQLRQYGFIGEISMSLAHNIKNPLMIINGCVKQLPEECDSLKHIILYQTNRINEVVNELLSAGNFRQNATTAPLDLNDVLMHSMALMGKQCFNKKISFQTDLEDPLPPFPAKEIHMRQIFSNLILNAMEAITDNGIIRLKSSREASQIVIRISDTGNGVPPQALPQIFLPYYTTKKNSTGMGLFLVKKTLEQYGGTICADSGPGKGTVFTITLPADTCTDTDF